MATQISLLVSELRCKSAVSATSLLTTRQQATIWSFWGLAFITTVIRIIARLRIQQKFQAEDYFAIFAFLLLTGLTSVITVMAPLFGTEQDYLEELAVDADAVPPYPINVMEDRMILALKLMFS
jgi:FtsH-binding integral membrane protein